MAETDNPLKRLLQAAIEDFAAWLLAAEIRDVQTVNIEFSDTFLQFIF
jgi:hypothetical protein